MTKKQLIEALADFPDDADIIVVYVANQVDVTVDILAPQVADNNGAAMLMTTEFAAGDTHKRWFGRPQG